MSVKQRSFEWIWWKTKFASGFWLEVEDNWRGLLDINSQKSQAKHTQMKPLWLKQCLFFEKERVTDNAVVICGQCAIHRSKAETAQKRQKVYIHTQKTNLMWHSTLTVVQAYRQISWKNICWLYANISDFEMLM